MYSEKPSKTSKNLKRLAVILKPENMNEVISMLNSSGLEATIYDVKGATMERHRVESGRGSGTADVMYATRKIVATVVNANDVEEIVERMRKALNGDRAVVLVSSVDDLLRL
jgi:nitrogen regulatory protein PII